MKEKQKKIKAKGAVGVYFRNSETKRFRGKPDKCYYVVYRNSIKKLIWEKVGWTSEGYSVAMASNIRAERIRSIRHGDELQNEKPKDFTFEEVWKKYDKWQENNLSRPRDNRYRYNLHLKKRFGNKLLSEISPLELEELKSDLLKAGKSPATAKHVLVLVRQVFNKAKAWGLYQGENPIKNVKLPKPNNRRERFLTYEESHILLDELKIRNSQLHNMALLSLHTGMRAGEIFNLKWGHIDFTQGLIHVADPKSGTSRKTLLTESLRLILGEKKGKPEELVFKNRKGVQIREVSNSFFRIIKNLGFNDGITDRRQRVTFHTLRHTFASWLAINGTHILAIKELMGHKTLAMTERYSHLIPDVKQEAVKGLEQAFLAGQKSEQSGLEKRGLACNFIFYQSSDF